MPLSRTSDLDPRTFLRPAPSPAVVSFRASWPAWPDFAGGEDLLYRLVVRLLDKGTRHRSRFEIAEWLEGRGASLSFYTDGYRLGFSGRALRADLADVLALAAEQLAEPALDPVEFVKAQAWLDAAIRSAEEDAGAQADAALSRALYHPTHPHFERDFPEERARLAAFTHADVEEAHRRAFRRPALTLALAGDVESLREDELLARFESADPAAAPDAIPPARHTPGTTDVPLPGKVSFDVRLGHGLALRRTDEDFLPLRMAVFALGGNFSSRLMQTVRDVHGLTYGIGASLSGLDAYHDGHVEVSVTLSPENLDRGVAVTREVVAQFVEEGISEAEVETVRTTLAGTHLVGLSTSGGTAAALLHAVEQGLGSAYLDALPGLLAAISREEINRVLRRHLDPDALYLVRAGTWSKG
ncbi:MAG TPA: pitrilysin family protein [Rhodothermales bacterium]|nr:pitrilysin family protein [Rhodothermales bacterium]